MTKTNYSCGFLFDESFTRVVLIRKLRPKWQQGLLNGVGGKLKHGETYHATMRREFGEETGLIVEDWCPFCDLAGDLGNVSFFYQMHRNIDSVQTMTDEGVEIVHVSTLANIEIVNNLLWLIPMAMSMAGETAEVFKVKGVYL